MHRFKDKVALVTGGRSGIGRAIARRLQDEGALVLTAQRGPDDEFESIAADFADPAAAAAGIEKALAIKGRLDVLVNNAGMMQEMSVEAMSLEEWTRNLNVNLTTPFMLIKTALPYLRVRGGAIVNISSIEGLGANPLHAAYGSSKAGLHGLTRAVAIDHGPENIRCNAVAPGWVDTDINVDFINNLQNDDFRNAIGRIHPLGRTGKPEEIASLVAWLASDEAAFVTGQVWTMDGGRMAKLSLPA